MNRFPKKLPLTYFQGFQSQQSRFVWQTMSLHQALINLHFSRVSNQNPLLIFHCDNPIRNMLCFAQLSGSNDIVVREISIPFPYFMPQFTVTGSCNGLLCLADTHFKDTVCIYNPFTRHYKLLPKSTVYDKEEVVVCGLGYHPVTKGYKVVYVGSRHRIIQKHKFLYYYFERRPMVNTNGRLHWTQRGSTYFHGLAIVSFDQIPRPAFGNDADCHSYNLAVLKRCLSAVVYGSHNDLEI